MYSGNIFNTVKLTSMKSTISLLLLIIGLNQIQAQKATYIANEGVLIQYQNSKILIDGLFDAENFKFDAPESTIAKKIIAGKSPYNDIDYLLATHAHNDHFDAAMTAHFLLKNRNAHAITTRHAADSIAAFEGSEMIIEQVRQVPFVKNWSTYTNDGAIVKTAYVKHAGKKNVKVQQLLFYITIGGKKILHIGDANQDLTRFAYLNLDNEAIDIAFIPFWYLTNIYGVEAVKKYFNPKKIVAIHLPASGSPSSIAKIKQQDPSTIIFSNQGQVISF